MEFGSVHAFLAKIPSLNKEDLRNEGKKNSLDLEINRIDEIELPLSQRERRENEMKKKVMNNAISILGSEGQNSHQSFRMSEKPPVCPHCMKIGHDESNCWTLHPDKAPPRFSGPARGNYGNGGRYPGVGTTLPYPVPQMPVPQMPQQLNVQGNILEDRMNSFEVRM